VHDTMTIEVGWWSEIDDQIIACLRDGPQSTDNLAWRLGISAAAVTSLLLMLAAEGKVRVTGAELMSAN
jgi:predicted ArsR family transcriptional regulator